MTSAASARCGTAFGLTKLVASITVWPASSRRSMNASFVSVGSVRSAAWRPSRGPTSTICTRSGRRERSGPGVTSGYRRISRHPGAPATSGPPQAPLINSSTGPTYGRSRFRDPAVNGGIANMPKQLAIAVIGVLLFAIVFPARAQASPEYARTDLSSLAAIEAYLVSIGVDPASVVVQQGRLNYAGPDCPGADWNCTTATKVVQISQGSSPAANIFDCLPALDAQIMGLNECVIVQSSAQ